MRLVSATGYFKVQGPLLGAPVRRSPKPRTLKPTFSYEDLHKLLNLETWTISSPRKPVPCVSWSAPHGPLRLLQRLKAAVCSSPSTPSRKRGAPKQDGACLTGACWSFPLLWGEGGHLSVKATVWQLQEDHQGPSPSWYLKSRFPHAKDGIRKGSPVPCCSFKRNACKVPC